MELTKEQKDLAQRAKKQNMLTRDPLVNWTVDKTIAGEELEYDAKLYSDEIAAWERSGGIFLK